MKHLFSLFLVFSLLSSVILFTVSCAPAKEDRPDENPAPTPGGPTDTDDSKIYVPPFKVYDDRRAVRLSSVTYRAPDTDALLLALEEAASLLIANEATPDEQSAKIRSLAPAFSEQYRRDAALGIHAPFRGAPAPDSGDRDALCRRRQFPARR